MRSFHCVLMVVTALASVEALSAETRPNNPYGVHLMIHDARTDANIDHHTAWARRVCGPWGYVKIFEYGITPETRGPDASQVKLVQTLYDRQLIPVVRLGGLHVDGIWKKPADTPEGTYEDIAQAFKRVVAGLPLSEKCPLYIEVWNEANLGLEWSGTTRPAEFAKFYMATFRAIRSIGDDRILISPGAMSPGGEYNSLKFIDAMCKAEPEFVHSFDYWATHPYPAATPPEDNIHDGTTTRKFACIDLWVHELERLKAHGCEIGRLKVMGTETGYFLGQGGNEGYPIIDRERRADYHLRTFRDYWGQWPEVLGMCIWDFAHPFEKMNNSNWVHADSTTDATGWPSRPTLDFEYVAALAKPTSSYGCVSGRFVDTMTKGPVPDVTVKHQGSDLSFTSDRFGNFILSPIPTSEKAHAFRFQSSSHGGSVFRVKVAAGQNVVKNIPVISVNHGGIDGQVINSAKDEGLVGAEITVEPGGFHATSDDEGRFRFPEVPHGYYTITASKPGFLSHVLGEHRIATGDPTAIRLTLGPGEPIEENLVRNGGFERSEPGSATALGWAPIGDANRIALVGESSYVGTRSQRLHAVGGREVGLIQWTGYSSIEPGKRYRLQCRAWTRGVRAGKGRGVYLAGTVVTNPHKTLAEIQSKQALTGDTQWTLITADFTAPPEAGRVSLEIRLDGEKGYAWVDEAAVFEVAP